MKTKIKFLASVLLLLNGVTFLYAQKNDWLECYNVQRAIEVIDDNAEEASQYLLKEVNQRPLNGYAWLLLARCHKTVSNYGTVLDYSTKAINNLRMWQHDNLWLSMAYDDRAEAYEVLENKEAQLSDLTEAVKAASKLKGDNATADPLLTRAQYYYDEAEYDKADADYRAAITVDSHNAVPYIGLSRDAFARGRYEEAADFAKKSFEIDPEYLYYHAYLAPCYYAQKDYEHAAEELVEAMVYDGSWSTALSFALDSLNLEFREALNVKVDAKLKEVPDNMTLVVARMYANIYGDSLHKADAERMAQKLIDLNSEESSNFSCGYSVARQSGNYDLAFDRARKACELDSTKDGNLQNIAYACLDLGRLDEARRYAEKAIDLFPDDADNYILAARIEAADQKMDAAVEQARIAYLLDPTESFNSSYLVCFLSKAGLTDEMKCVAEEALKQDTVPIYSSNRAHLLAHLGRFEEALAWVQQQMEKDPVRIENLLVDKAEVLLIKGDVEAARGAYREAIKAGWMRTAVFKWSVDFREHPELFENL